MAEVFIALGSNLGDRNYHIGRARLAMQRMGIRVTASSSIYETEPWGPVKQDRYLNQVIRGSTKLPPHALLLALRRIEKSLGRDRSRETRFGPRTADLDILLYEGINLRTRVLQIPHPRMMQRAFVLVPLAKIAPGLIVHGMPVRRALQRLDSSGIAKL